MKQLLFVAIFLAILAGCGRPSRMPGEMDSLMDPQSIDFQALNAAIFTPKCAACHANFTTYAGIMASGVIVNKNPEQSALYIRTSNGSMPRNGLALSDAEVTAIYNWISAGSPGTIAGGGSGGTTTPPGGGTTTPGGSTDGGTTTPGTPEPTFAWIQANVLNARCVICHRGARAPAGYDLSSYENVIDGGRVIAGNPSGSTLLQRISNNTMPPGGTGISAEAKQMITLWIQNGAKNDGTSSGGGTTAPPPLPPLEPKFNSIMANIIGPRCLACHDSVQRTAGVVLQDYNSVMQQVVRGNASRSELYEVLEDNDMPASGGPLTFQQKEVIRQWINSGAVNN